MLHYLLGSDSSLITIMLHCLLIPDICSLQSCYIAYWAQTVCSLQSCYIAYWSQTVCSLQSCYIAYWLRLYAHYNYDILPTGSDCMLITIKLHCLLIPDSLLIMYNHITLPTGPRLFSLQSCYCLYWAHCALPASVPLHTLICSFTPEFVSLATTFFHYPWMSRSCHSVYPFAHLQNSICPFDPEFDLPVSWVSSFTPEFVLSVSQFVSSIMILSSWNCPSSPHVAPKMLKVFCGSQIAIYDVKRLFWASGT